MIYLKLLTLNKQSFNSQNRTEQNYVFLKKKKAFLFKTGFFMCSGQRTEDVIMVPKRKYVNTYDGSILTPVSGSLWPLFTLEIMSTDSVLLALCE